MHSVYTGELTPRYSDLNIGNFMLPPAETQPVDSRRPEAADPRPDLILQLVKRHPDGIATSDIRECLERVHGTKVTTNYVLKVLRDFEHEREIYSRVIGRSGALVWYPNGRLVHGYLELYRELRGKKFRVTVQESRSGPAVQVQERSYSLLDGERVEGALFVDYVCLDEFIDMLQEIKRRFEEHDTQKGKTR